MAGFREYKADDATGLAFMREQLIVQCENIMHGQLPDKSDLYGGISPH